MNSKTTNYIILSTVILSFVLGIVFYPELPDQIASHWNASGEVDGYMSKFWGTFFLPFMMAGMYLFYLIIPKIDPLKKNIESFKSVYNQFWLWMFVFILYINVLSLSWNLGLRFNFTVAMVPAMALLFYVIGNLLEKSKRNWFVGIRTPWTLSDDVVWDKTHRLGGRLFKLMALFSLSGFFVNEKYIIFTIIIPVIAVTVITFVYSYVEYKKILKK